MTPLSTVQVTDRNGLNLAVRRADDGPPSRPSIAERKQVCQHSAPPCEGAAVCATFVVPSMSLIDRVSLRSHLQIMTATASNQGFNLRGMLRTDLVAVSLVMHLLGLALPLALLQIYDRVLPSEAYGTAAFLILGVGVAITLESILRYGRYVMFAALGARYEASLTMQALGRLQHADVAGVEKLGVAFVNDALRAIGQVRDFLSGQSGMALYELPFVAVYIALIAYIGGWLALIPVLLLLAAILISLILMPLIRRFSSATEWAARQRQDFAWTVFNDLSALKATGAESSLRALWRSINARSLSSSAELETRLGWLRENASSIAQLSTALVVVFGALIVIDGGMTTGALAACTMLAGRSIGPSMASLAYWAQLARIREAQAQIDALLALPDALPTLADAGAAEIGKGALHIEAPSLLRSPLTLEPGEVVWFTAKNTATTSRMFAAIAGLSQDDSIRVRIDDHELGAYTPEIRHAALALVSSHLALVPGTILQNLTLYDPRHEQEVPAVCEALGLKAYLDSLQYGLLTEVGPGAAEQIDAGIAQRIAIARALLRQPRILLLDHAASGMDMDGVKRLSQLLCALQGRTTVLVATHKQPLIEACTRVVELTDEGGTA